MSLIYFYDFSCGCALCGFDGDKIDALWEALDVDCAILAFGMGCFVNCSAHDIGDSCLLDGFFAADLESVGCRVGVHVHLDVVWNIFDAVIGGSEVEASAAVEHFALAAEAVEVIDGCDYSAAPCSIAGG